MTQRSAYGVAANVETGSSITLNATAAVPLLLGDAAHPPNPALAGVLGLPGLAVLAVTALVVAQTLNNQRIAEEVTAKTNALTAQTEATNLA